MSEQISTTKISRRIKLLKSVIEGLPLPAKGEMDQEWSALAEYIGLRIIASHTGRKTWFFRCTFNGRKFCLRIGEFPAITVQEAKNRVLSYKNSLAQGINPRDEVRRLKTTPTFRDFCEEEFLPHIAARNKTYRETIGKLERCIYPAFGGRLITSITRADILHCTNLIRAQKSPATANRYTALLSGVFRLAVELELLKKNPAKGIERYQESSGNERFLSDHEITHFLTALEKSRSRQAALALQLLLATGMRKSEVLTLPWFCVDLERGQLKLERGVTKNKRARMVVLNEAAVKILQEMRGVRVKGNPYVFPGDKPESHLSDLRKTFLTAVKRAGIAACRIHDLRHTFCAKLASSGVSLIIIANLAGHRCLRTTERYSHLDDQCLRDASAIMGTHLNSASACGMLPGDQP